MDATLASQRVLWCPSMSTGKRQPHRGDRSMGLLVSECSEGLTRGPHVEPQSARFRLGNRCSIRLSYGATEWPVTSYFNSLPDLPRSPVQDRAVRLSRSCPGVARPSADPRRCCHQHAQPPRQEHGLAGRAPSLAPPPQSRPARGIEGQVRNRVHHHPQLLGLSRRSPTEPSNEPQQHPQANSRVQQDQDPLDCPEPRRPMPGGSIEQQPKSRDEEADNNPRDSPPLRVLAPWPPSTESQCGPRSSPPLA